MLYIDARALRKLGGLQDKYLAEQANTVAEKKVSPAKPQGDRRQHLVGEVATICRGGQPTPFAYEGACRHGLRRGFCLDGVAWAKADATAAEIVAAALRQSAKRPTWARSTARCYFDVALERTRCARCGRTLARRCSRKMDPFKSVQEFRDVRAAQPDNPDRRCSGSCRLCCRCRGSAKKDARRLPLRGLWQTIRAPLEARRFPVLQQTMFRGAAVRVGTAVLCRLRQ